MPTITTMVKIAPVDMNISLAEQCFQQKKFVEAIVHLNKAIELSH